MFHTTFFLKQNKIVKIEDTYNMWLPEKVVLERKGYLLLVIVISDYMRRKERKKERLRIEGVSIQFKLEKQQKNSSHLQVEESIQLRKSKNQ